MERPKEICARGAESARVISRRDFLGMAGLALAGAALPAPSRAEGPRSSSPHFLSTAQLSAVWVHDGFTKIPQEDLPAAGKQFGLVRNSLWNGREASVAGARNEIVSFSVVCEACRTPARRIGAGLGELVGPNGYRIASRPAQGEQLFDLRGRPIRLYHIGYLQIKGLSELGYNTRDEQSIPPRFRAAGAKSWENRPDHDKHYPDVAVPLERVGEFGIEEGKSQSLWVDVYIPKDAPAGEYRGQLVLSEHGESGLAIPVKLRVRNFALPDLPPTRTMLYIETGDIYRRYLGAPQPRNAEEAKLAQQIVDRHFQTAHRRRLALISQNDEGSAPAKEDRPQAEWLPRLDGSLFSKSAGYEGPGEGVGNGVFSIGTYGTWDWKNGDRAEMQRRTDAWEQWFQANLPGVERFLYLADETRNYGELRGWTESVESNPGVGRGLKTFATISAADAVRYVPQLDVAANHAAVHPSGTAEAVRGFQNAEGKGIYFYNGTRPYSGSFMIDDEGTALRMIPWVQYKLGVGWFYWNGTYYNNYQGGAGANDVYRTAQTFGAAGAQKNAVLGETSRNYSNGDGVLFYPGTDRVFPRHSLDLPGPVESLRLMMLARGIQDVCYLEAARRVDPERTARIVNAMVPAPLWQWQKGREAWAAEPGKWTQAVEELANIIEGR